MFKLVVLSCALAVSSASVIGPLGLAGLGLGWGGHLASPLAPAWPLAAPLVSHAALAGPVAVAAAPAIGAYNYRGPLSLAPGQPANILAADGRPLDTLSVNLDRAAHLTARAVDASHGLHLLKKRSAPLLSPLAVSHTARLDIPAAHLGVPALGLHGLSPIAPIGLGPLGVGHLGGPLGVGHLGGPLGVGHLGGPLGVGHLGVGPWGHAGLW